MLDIHDLVIGDFGIGDISSHQGTFVTKISFINDYKMFVCLLDAS